MLRKLIGLLCICLITTPAIGQNAGGTQTFANWFPVARASLSVSNVSARVAFGSTGPTAVLCNTGSVDAYYKLGTDNTVTVTTANGFLISAGNCLAVNLKPFSTQYTYVAGITISGTTTLYIESGVGNPAFASFVPTASPYNRLATYSVLIAGYAAYATPTDMITLCATTKVVRLTTFNVPAQSASATVITFYWVKRSSVDTGGTPTAQTPLPYDSADSTATATVTTYGSAPSLGTTVANLRYQQAATGTTTPATFTIGSPPSNIIDIRQSITLHNGECIALNFNGAALPGTFTSNPLIEWTESAS